jgi:DNA-binding protein YbaB
MMLDSSPSSSNNILNIYKYKNFSMFNKLKQFKDLRSQAKQMQNALAQEIIIVENNGVKVELNGNMEIISLIINDNLNKEQLEKIIKNTINEALQKAQKTMAKKIQDMGGLGNFGL